MLPDETDTLFWQETVKDVAQMPQEQIPNKPNPPQVVIHEHRHFALKQEFSTYSKALDDKEFGGIDKSTLKKFKQEEFKIEAVLDLHGQREDNAFEQVEEFIVQSYAAGKRCVIIVTGKGIHQQDDLYARGVLKKQVPQWLNLPRIRAMILIFKNPSERLGGEGALYILLRRNRDL